MYHKAYNQQISKTLPTLHLTLNLKTAKNSSKEQIQNIWQILGVNTVANTIWKRKHGGKCVQCAQCYPWCQRNVP